MSVWIVIGVVVFLIYLCVRFAIHLLSRNSQALPEDESALYQRMIDRGEG